MKTTLTNPHLKPSHYTVVGDMEHATTSHRTVKGALREMNRRFNVGTRNVQLTIDRVDWSNQLQLSFNNPDNLPTEATILLRELHFAEKQV